MLTEKTDSAWVYARIAAWSVIASLARQACAPYHMIPNVIGCLLMGLFRNASTAVLVGCLGSLTTFAGWINDTNDTIQLYATLPVCFVVYHLGSRVDQNEHKYAVQTVSSVCGIGILLGIVLQRFRWEDTLAFVFAPCGSLVRYILARRFNNKQPYGTWIANLLGTGIVALCARFSSGPAYLLYPVRIHTAGSLSTLSTFVKECLAKPITYQRVVYGVGSVGCAVALVLLVRM